jgi:hypothetical protein
MTQTQIDNLLIVKDNPVEFAKIVLGESDEDLEPHHRTVLSSVSKNRKTAWKSGHGVGKTWTSSVSALWFFATRPSSKTIVTASAWRQVEKQLMPEIMRLARHADWGAIGLEGMIEPLKLMLYMKGNPEWFISAEASDEPMKMEGFHAPNLFYIVDEGKAVPDGTYESIEGAFTNVEGDIRELVISTPSAEKAGYFYDIFAGKRIGFVKHSTSCLDSKRISQGWIEERKKEWGEDSPMYITRVLGEFADAGQDTLFPLAWLERCVNKQVPDGKKIIGVDVARYGSDRTVITKRIGKRVVGQTVTTKEDTMQTVGRVKSIYKQENYEEVRVDVIGVGAGVVDRLLEEDINVVGINNASSASDTEKFTNVRAESYWGLRERVRDGDISIPEDDELLSELTNIKYKYNSRGQLYIESKEDIKKRGLRSPDKSDSLVLAFYENLSPEPILAFG